MFYKLTEIRWLIVCDFAGALLPPQFYTTAIQLWIFRKYKNDYNSTIPHPEFPSEIIPMLRLVHQHYFPWAAHSKANRLLFFSFLFMEMLQNVYKAENRVLFWLLIFFALLIALAILTLLLCCACPWCPLYNATR